MFPTTTTQRETLPEVAEDLLDTLLICWHALPEDTHPIHQARIRLTKQIIVHATRSEANAAYWAAELRRVEHQVDVQRKAGGR